MRFAITGTDARFLPLRKLLLADGHEITDPASADMVISPPWDPSARYARREEYQIAIARLTAEGAIALLRPETGLSGAHILLLGYGRIARLLARELQKAGALVTAAARSGEQRAWAEAESIEALPLDALSGALDRFDVIIGTIPAPVLTEPLLALVRKDALLLELASAPGGIDAAAAHERGLRYIRAPGLPAKYAPERAAVILRDAVYAAAAEPLPRLGLAVTGSHCTFSRALEAFRPLKRDYTLVPILSGAAAGTDTRFFAASAFRAELEAFCGREAVDTIVKAEPLGTAQRLDALLATFSRGRLLKSAARSQSLPAASRTPPLRWRARRICETARRSFSPFPQTTVSPVPRRALRRFCSARTCTSSPSGRTRRTRSPSRSRATLTFSAKQ